MKPAGQPFCSAGNRRHAHGTHRMDALPVQAFNQRRELRCAQPKHAVLDLRSTELTSLQTLGREDKPASIPDQELHPISAF